jgi:hypothetical protein
MATLVTGKRRASTESLSNIEDWDTENEASARALSRRVSKKPRINRRQSFIPDIQDKVLTLLQEESRRHAEFEDRIERLIAKSIDDAQVARREFMALMKNLTH